MTHEEAIRIMSDSPLSGVRFNVIRRPLSGGKGTIVKHKGSKSNPDGESYAEYYERLRVIISESPEEFFFRWNVTITPEDIEKFKVQCLNPMLEQLCDWYEHILNCIHAENSPFHISASQTDPKGIHWRFPYGVWNPMLEGAPTEMDQFLNDGNMTGLRVVDRLFTELDG